MSRVAVYTGTDSGGSLAGSCTAPPFAIQPLTPAAPPVLFSGLPAILNYHVLTPSPGTTPKGDPCVIPRTAVATQARVLINGLPVCRIGDSLNPAAGITILASSQNTGAPVIIGN